MTFIQSSGAHGGLYTRIMFGFLMSVLFGGVVWLVVILNGTVTFRDNLASGNVLIQEIETKSSEIKDAMLRATDSGNLKGLARSRGLIQEKNLRYIETSRTWAAFASRY